MKVKCPKCEAVYKMDDSKIPDNGAYARCPKCKERFFVKKKDSFQGIVLETDKEEVKASKEEPITGKNTGYIEKNLLSGENVLYRGKLHWAVFLAPAFFIIVAIFFFSVGGTVEIGGLIFLFGIAKVVDSVVNYTTSEFGVTNKRVIVKVGFIRRKSLETFLNKIEGIQVSQGVLGRILGFGSITVSGTGGTKDPFHKISKPLEFRKMVQEQVASIQDSK